MSAPTFAGLLGLCFTVEMLAVFVIVAIDADRAADAADEASRRAAEVAVRKYVAEATPTVDGRLYVARASRLPLPVTPRQLDRARESMPWRAALAPGMGWLTSGHRHTRLAEPWPELAERLRRERAFLQPTAEFRAIVARALFDVAAAAIEPARAPEEITA